MAWLTIEFNGKKKKKMGSKDKQDFIYLFSVAFIINLFFQIQFNKRQKRTIGALQSPYMLTIFSQQIEVLKQHVRPLEFGVF